MGDGFLITAILERLPLKSVVRFRVVCKDWYNIIRSSNFIYDHLKRSHETETNMVLLDRSAVSYNYYAYISPSRFDLPREFRPADYYCEFGCSVEVLGACNGLICIISNPKFTKLALCNPITRDFRILPSLDDDPRDSTAKVALGFGYDSSTDDYKVVKITNTSGSCSLVNGDEVEATVFMIKVYSMHTNSWKTILVKEDIFPARVSFIDNAAYLNNTLHWPMKTCHGTYCIGSFHLPSEQVGYMSMPDFISVFIFRVFDLRILGGCLCVQLLGATSHSETWIMEEYGKVESWTKLFSTVKKSHLLSELSSPPLPIACHSVGKGRKFVLLTDLDNADQFIKYNLKKGPYERLKVYNKHITSSQLQLFVGSLVAIPNGDSLYRLHQKDKDKAKEQELEQEQSFRKRRKIEVK